MSTHLTRVLQKRTFRQAKRSCVRGSRVRSKERSPHFQRSRWHSFKTWNVSLILTCSFLGSLVTSSKIWHAALWYWVLGINSFGLNYRRNFPDVGHGEDLMQPEDRGGSRCVIMLLMFSFCEVSTTTQYFKFVLSTAIQLPKRFHISLWIILDSISLLERWSGEWTKSSAPSKSGFGLRPTIYMPAIYFWPSSA